MKSLEYYCAILGVDLNVSPEQLKQAYRDLVKVWHPDRFGLEPGLQAKAEAKLKEINEAYKELQPVIADRAAENIQTQAATAEPRPRPQESASTATQAQPRATKKTHRSTKPRPKFYNFLLTRRARPFAFGLAICLGVLIVSHIVNPFDPEIREPPSAAIPLVSSLEPSATARHSPQRELHMMRADIVKTMKESYDGALRLLALHEAEKKRTLEEFLKRRDLLHQGLISQSEVSQAERALATATARVEEDRRWLVEAEIAIAEAAVANERLQRKK